MVFWISVDRGYILVQCFVTTGWVESAKLCCRVKYQEQRAAGLRFPRQSFFQSSLFADMQRLP